jgi:hypothetical protein
VENPARVEGGVKEVWVNGQAQDNHVIRLSDDGRAHEVRVVLG